MTTNDLTKRTDLTRRARGTGALRAAGHKPFVLDSTRPTIPLREYAYNENRYKVLLKTNPEEAERMMQMAQETVNRRWQTYVHLSKQEPTHLEQAGQAASTGKKKGETRKVSPSVSKPFRA
ncbi:MAG: hypothetical protein KJO95_13255 [Gammaproteobacteria bacterium]|nr:hypothetical protein [Gammaproteobacteria bacterium]NNC56599.1 hypothetical protein [Woeseiaceae bacterium]